jgi:hypothetical protein
VVIPGCSDVLSIAIIATRIPQENKSLKIERYGEFDEKRLNVIVV